MLSAVQIHLTESERARLHEFFRKLAPGTKAMNEVIFEKKEEQREYFFGRAIAVHNITKKEKK